MMTIAIRMARSRLFSTELPMSRLPWKTVARLNDGQSSVRPTNATASANSTPSNEVRTRVQLRNSTGLSKTPRNFNPLIRASGGEPR